MEFWEIIRPQLIGNTSVALVVLFVVADTVFGWLRAVKQRRFNSSFGINGAIRKVAMFISMVFLVIFDAAVSINLAALLPQTFAARLGLERAGTTEFFAVMFLSYEAASILKNMVLCGLPLGAVQTKVTNFLAKYTDELPIGSGEETDNGNIYR